MVDSLDWLWVAVLVIVVVPPAIISIIMFIPEGDEEDRAGDESSCNR